MTDPEPYAALMSPVTIRSLSVRNRVVRTAHGTNIGAGSITDELVAYHVERAAGGVGLSVLEAASVHPTDMGTLVVHDDSVVDGYRALVEAVEPHGMRIFQQLGHLGAEGRTADGSPPWSASAIPSLTWGVQAHPMTAAEIDEIVEAFARAARICAEGGLHGVEVHCAHSYLIQQFLSAATNRRSDDWGGSFENRARLARDVVDAVRAAVGDEFVVGIRVGAEGDDEGMDADDAGDLAEHLVDNCDIDYVSVTLGGARVPHLIFGGMHEPSGYELPTSEPVTARLSVPTIVTGRFRTLDEADEVVRSGVADMVGMTRAHIADAGVIAKTLAGRADRVRPCIACNQGCVGGLARGRMTCAVNPRAGYETSRVLTPASRRRRVVVVGGGPAGLEAARVAAERGHEVHIVERGGQLGGAVRDAARLPWRSLIADAVDWQTREIHHLGVAVSTGVDFSTAVADGLDADEIVWAVGATASRGSLDGLRDELGVPVVTPSSLLADPPTGPGRAAVVDEHGGYEALGLSEVLLNGGLAVTVVSPDRVLARRIRLDVVFKPTMDRLKERSFEVLAGRAVAGAAAGELVVADGDGATATLPVDLAVVVAKEPTPPPDGVDTRVVGDAAEPDTLMGAFHSGFEAGAAL